MDYEEKHEYKNKTRITVKIMLVIGLIISISIISIILLDKDKNNISTTTALTEENNEIKEPVTPKIDNSGYLSLGEDPNAEDALQVNSDTEGLITKKINYPVRKDGKKVAYLTFDDGPSTINTPSVLDILKKQNIKATFFVLGREIDSGEDSKKILRRIVKEGHAIGNHSYGHNYNYLYPNRTINVNNFMADIEKTNETFRNVLGKDFSTRAIRFPGGYWSWEGRTGIRPIINEKGYGIIDWNAIDGDAESNLPKNSEQLLARTKQTVEDLGPNADSIVCLMHDTYGKEETVKALPKIIELFKEKGFEFKSIK